MLKSRKFSECDCSSQRRPEIVAISTVKLLKQESFDLNLRISFACGWDVILQLQATIALFLWSFLVFWALQEKIFAIAVWDYGALRNKASNWRVTCWMSIAGWFWHVSPSFICLQSSLYCKLLVVRDLTNRTQIARSGTPDVNWPDYDQAALPPTQHLTLAPTCRISPISPARSAPSPSLFLIIANQADMPNWEKSKKILY